MLGDMVNWIVDMVGALGYLGIIVMMFLESSFFPFPSEVVMIPAGYLASKGEMNLYVVIGSGILGSLLGAVFNYYLARTLGRRIIIRWGRYFFFSEATMAKMENFFHKHGPISTFSGRLIPAVRQYISLPAGLSKMRLDLFCLYTALGAGIWMVVLTLLGFFIGKQEALVKPYLQSALAITLVAVTVLIILYMLFQRHKRRELP
jgi:membrane protein DedA with SNARE-associated domain